MSVCYLTFFFCCLWLGLKGISSLKESGEFPSHSTCSIFSFFRFFSPSLDILFQFLGFLPLQSNSVQTYSASEYDLGEGDLFKAPEPIIEEPDMGLDPITAISMISYGEEVISPQTINMSDLESFQTEQLFNEVLYQCEKDLLERSVMEEQFSDISDVKIPLVSMDEDQIAEKDRLVLDGSIQKSVSSGCLSSMEWINGCGTRPNFLDFKLVDFGDAYGMRRAYSEGDIQVRVD